MPASNSTPSPASSTSLPVPCQWRRIGLTGGIASGKSTVSRYLETHYRLPVLDADVYARQAVAPGSRILRQVCDRYGTAVQQADGRLNRSQLGQIIFNDVAERRWLEGQIHPFVRAAFVQDVERLESGEWIDPNDTQETKEHPEGAGLVDKTVVLAIPLLFEVEMTELVSEVWVVTCPPEVQLARLMKRDRISKQDAQARIASQMPLSEKVALADVVLDNGATPETLFQQVDTALLLDVK